MCVNVRLALRACLAMLSISVSSHKHPKKTHKISLINLFKAWQKIFLRTLFYLVSIQTLKHDWKMIHTITIILFTNPIHISPNNATMYDVQHGSHISFFIYIIQYHTQTQTHTLYNDVISFGISCIDCVQLIFHFW